MVRRKLIAPIAAAAIAAMATLTTCTNPNAFIGAVKDEAKSALGMFLAVSSISPVKNAAEVNPNATIQVDFDRALDTATVVADNILVAPSSAPTAYVSWTYAYDVALKRLLITPAALDGGVSYIVTIKKGLSSSIGEPLQADYTWNFGTAALPGGTIKINGGAAYANSSTSSIVLTLCPNNLATHLSYNLGSPPSPPFLGIPVTKLVTYSPVSNYLTGGDNTYTLYYQYQTDTEGVVSGVYSTSIILDTTPPNPPTLSPVSGSSVTHYPVWSWVSGGNGGNGAFNYYINSAWSGETAAVSYSPAAGLANGSYTFYIKERDAAGNWSSLSSSTLAITAPPNAPVVSATSPTLDTTPTWSWTSGGFGNGNFQYQLDSTAGVWTATVATSYTPAALADGTHTLYVQESDGAEFSASGAKAIRVTPVIPGNGTTGVSTLPALSWRGSGVRNTSYAVQFYSGEKWTTVATSTVPSYTFTTALSILTTYTWRVVYGTTYVPSSSGATFTTKGSIRF